MHATAYWTNSNLNPTNFEIFFQYSIIDTIPFEKRSILVTKAVGGLSAIKHINLFIVPYL